MGNENKDKAAEEIKNDNNPFAAVNDVNEKGDSVSSEQIPEDGEIADEITSLKSELEKVNNQYIRLAAGFDN